MTGSSWPGRPVPALVVAQDGSGDFRTIQGALNSLSRIAENPRHIFIRKGIYREKLYIEKPNIRLEGEDMESTVIVASVARDEWRCAHKDDWGVATLNIGADHITLKNLTVTNNFGFEYTEPVTISCATDTSGDQNRVLKKDGHQMAVRTMNATKMKAIHCLFRSFGGDTVSPWEVDNGMWYFKDCIMEGGVDFYCPRGWAWAENCEFIAHSGPAAIWHDGSKHRDSKSVLYNCRFNGYDGFRLGRYHRDAQFYLVNCAFADNMKDEPIYRVPTSNVIQWGERVYYYNCSRKAGNYSWFADNIDKETAKKISVKWVFGDRWNPVG